ncbi:MAG: glycosyltransferase family 39 protein [Candidatus Nanohaloarchaea archaeon]
MASGVVERVRATDDTWRFLAVIVLGGGVLRFLKLGSRPFWSDEALYSLGSMEVVQNLVFYPHYPTSGALVTGHPPLFYFITGGVARIAGTTSEFVMRFPTAVLGLLTVPVIYLLGEELFDRRTGILTALFLSVSTTHVIYSREALPVAMAMFFVSLAALALVKWVPPAGPRQIAAIVGLSLAALLSHFMNYSLFFLFAGLIGVAYWRDRQVPRKSLYIFLGLLVFAVSLMFFTLNQSTPPKTPNPVKGSIGLDEGIVSSAGAVPTFAGWIWGMVSSLSLGSYVSVLVEALQLYFNETVAYASLPLFLVPLLYAVWRYWQGIDAADIEHIESLVLTYLWFLGTLAMIVLFIWPVYAHQGLRPVRAYPFLLIPFILVIGAGAARLWEMEGRWGLVLPAVFVFLSVTHAVPVAADTPVYMDVDEVFFDVDPLNAKVWFQSFHTFQEADTITCGDDPVGEWFVCYPDHPVGYSDSIDWRAATAATLSRADRNATFYVSVAPAFVYYAGDGEELDVTGLQCNVDHRFCNIRERISSSARPVWIVADEERYSWQLNASEREYVENNCDGWNQGNVNIFRCT